MQGRLDYYFVKNSFQDVITHSDFFVALSTDHSPVTISISKSNKKITPMITVFGNSTVLCFQAKIMLEKQKILFKLFTVIKILFRMLS